MLLPLRCSRSKGHRMRWCHVSQRGRRGWELLHLGPAGTDPRRRNQRLRAAENKNVRVKAVTGVIGCSTRLTRHFPVVMVARRVYTSSLLAQPHANSQPHTFSQQQKYSSCRERDAAKHTLSKPLHTPSSTHLILHGRPSDKLVAVEIQSFQELPTHRTLETDHFYILDTHTRSGQSQSHACSPILSLETHSTKPFCIPSQPSSRPCGSRWSIEHSSLG